MICYCGENENTLSNKFYDRYYFYVMVLQKSKYANKCLEMFINGSTIG